MTYILTHSGRQVSYENDVVPSLEDIAHALSYIPRFAGHGSQPWSVLDHTLFCYDLARSLPELRYGAPSLGLAMLLHDAHESCTGDIPTPLKVAEQKTGQWLLDLKIMDAYFPGGHDAYDVLHHLVKQIDREALLVEAYRVGPPACVGSYEKVMEHFGARPSDRTLENWYPAGGSTSRVQWWASFGETRRRAVMQAEFLERVENETRRVIAAGA